MRRRPVDEALFHFREALRIDSRLPTHYNIGPAFGRRGDLREALDHFREALRLAADWAPPLADLAWVLATASDERFREPNEAVRLAERAAQLTGRHDPEALEVLAAALAAAGDFQRALEITGEALSLNPQPSLVANILMRQRLYERGQPYRQPIGPPPGRMP
jgi:tetratricopeptide (TPR) repeat protein